MRMKRAMHMPFNWTADGMPDYQNLPSPNPYPVPFEFERNIQFKWWAVFITSNQHLPVIAALIYIATIFGIQHYMRDRKPFHLKRELFYWNAALGIYSICALIRFWPEFVDVVFQEDGFYISMCSPGFSEPGLFWGLLYLWSKYVELGDTVFIALRKRPLVALQWYHHVVTLIGTWIAVPFMEPVNRWAVFLNVVVHSFMYPYFALRALDIHVPKKIANMITTMQLTQMLLDVFFQAYSSYLFYQGICYRHPTMITFLLFVFVSFLYLFGDLFYRTVILNNKNREIRRNAEIQKNLELKNKVK